MGIVINQSLKNTVTTYLGFGIGAINALFLYTNFISDEYYGLVAYILSAANIMMPLMAFGAHNTIVKFYSTFKTKNSLNSFMTLMLFLPSVLAIPVAAIGYFSYDAIADILSQKNDIVRDYLWYIFITAVAMAYFEVFYAWVKVQMQTVFGNFMKEVFHRVGAMMLLLSVFLNHITVDQFLMGIVGVYVIRAFVMMLYAFSKRLPVFKFNKIDKIRSILKYASLIIIAGSIATIILDLDKFMLNNYLSIEKVAYYSVAVFIATVIAVPQRAMHQILLPLTATFLNENKTKELSDLYQRSSLTLYVISGFIFLLIIVNINQLYEIIPFEFSGGLVVVFLISLAKLYDNLLGNNNAILFNSDYYYMVLFFGVFLAVLAVVLNLILIPLYGINGSALATFTAIVIYNTIKVYFVKLKFSMLPFTSETLKVTLVLIVMVCAFYFWDFPFHPIVNIALKSMAIAMVYGLLIYRLNISEDISEVLLKYLKRK
ncbi:polysaccharide biosynthesis C-terminal domain-containing protein [Psychroserpens algicola]|uniref:Polysaccharide biosynthesis C-terminal domain-containing protein n=1 Tax=Psychroserpens algicola TaxID=1719034 RepID=A0ABT0H8L6_9FLAO|nr:polysaccharide biosynthesis C-terminal domain-containing protein [Psychroserpens algicola]MCK8480705.1 polysaccharide biosynthesis C-terminal domain-containing protein [Psychroserpens algicola]